MEEANTLGVGAMGFGGEVFADRLQDYRRQPPARQFLRLGGLRLLGVPASRASCWMRRPARSRMALPRSERPVSVWRAAKGFPLTGREVVLTRAAHRRRRCAR